MRWPRDQRGFALVAALGLLVAFAAVGLGMGFRLRTVRLGAANAIDESRALAAADAGVAQFRLRLRDAVVPVTELRPESLLFRPDTVELDGARAVVTVRDAGTRLHLNRASPDELRRLFVALRIDAGDADRLAQAIADWRDPDGLRRPRGAEQREYIKEGAALPANRDFERLIELTSVLGMTAERYRRVWPYVTVHGSGRVNLNAADRPVILALPGMTETAVKVLVGQRAAGRPVRSLTELTSLLPSRSREALLSHVPALEARVVFETRDLDVLSEGRVTGSPVQVRMRLSVTKVGDESIVTWKQVE